MTRRSIKLFFDGGCRPNPGAMEIAVVFGGESHVRHDIGYGTNMDAEWAALIWALELAIAAGLVDVIILGDAKAVIDQANGHTKVRYTSARHFACFAVLAARAPAFRLRYVKRTQNLAGIALAGSRARR